MNKTRLYVIPAQAGICKFGVPKRRIPACAGMTILTLLLLSLSSISFSQGYKIETTVHNSTDTVAYLGHHFATQRYLDDTAKVVNGKAVFTGNKPLVEGIYFYYTPTTYFEFLIGEQDFSLETTSPDPITIGFTNSMKFNNSKTNEGFYKMQRFTKQMKAKNKLLMQELDSADNEETKEGIKLQLKELNTQVVNYQSQLKAEYSDTFLAKLIALMQSPKMPEVPDSIENKQLYKYKYYKNNFWNDIDIADPGLLRTPLLDVKIKEYLDNIVIQQSDSVIKEVDLLIAKASTNKEAFRYLLITLVNKYESSNMIDFDKVFVHLIETYYLTGQADNWTTPETLDKLKNRVAMIKPNFIGNDAPRLILWDTLGNEINLRGIEAAFTVLYFYSPECGHCKTKTPLLYESYPDLVAKGVEIIAICTDTDEKKWKDFIVKNDLGWINLADLESKTNVRYFYDIRSTPTVYILDKDKKIVLKKIDVLDIPNVIDMLIKQSKPNTK